MTLSDFQKAKATALNELDASGGDKLDGILDFANEFASEPSAISDITIAILSVRQSVSTKDRTQAIEALRGKVEAVTEAASDPFLSTALRRAAPKAINFQRRLRDTEAILKCVRVGKAFRDGKFRLSDISIEVGLKTVTAIVGRNGSGKSTLFDIIAGNLQHDHGTLTFPGLGFDSDQIDWFGVNQQLSYVPQELPPLHGNLRDNIQYEAAMRGILGRENERETSFVIERLGLSDFVSHGWNDLSGGYKLRFALARALVWKPKLLLLDEPLANLDFETQQLFLRDLRNLADSARDPIAVVLSSQHLHEIEPFLDQLLFLDQGNSRFYGPLSFLEQRESQGLFEFDVDLSTAQLRSVFQDMEVQDLSFEGGHYMLKLPYTVTADRVLDRFSRFGVRVHYFRNLGRSIKSLFLE